ncbi:helix-turn-helix protein [compost metagenome]
MKDLDIPEVFPKLEISKAIKNSLENKHLSIRKLAEIIGMKHPQILRVTRGDTNYHIETLLRILDALDLELIIKEKENKK